MPATQVWSQRQKRERCSVARNKIKNLGITKNIASMNELLADAVRSAFSLGVPQLWYITV